MMKGGIGGMMKQAQQLQANMQKAQAEIAAMEVTGESFRRPQIESRIAQLLATHFGEAIRLEIVQAEKPGEIMTPARQDEIVASDRQRAAEQAIETDPAVLAMREVFGASVRPGSTKPL